MMKTIEYFMIPSSPWTYLGHNRLRDIANRHGATIEIRPFDLGQVFPVSGGLPLPKRAPQRQTYRLAELARWRDFLKVPLTIQPKFFPVSADAALPLIAAAIDCYDQNAAFDLAGAFMKGVWVDEQNIADQACLQAITESCDLDYQKLIAQAGEAAKRVQQNTQDAIDTQVFGSPWYRVGDQNFWGQDRLDFVDRALAN